MPIGYCARKRRFSYDLFQPPFVRIEQSSTRLHVALIHNHPSGDPTPSKEDLEITRRLREVGDLVGVRVLDHIVIGRGRYVSFVDDGYW